MNIEQKIQAILAQEMLEAKRELLLFVNQTKETIRYQTDRQTYIKELLANYSNLSTDKNGYICFFGRWYVNSGFPVFSDEEILANMKRFYLCYVEKPMLGVKGAIDAAECEGGLFLERWNKYNWLKELLAKMAEPQKVQASTSKKTFRDKIIAKDKEELLNKLHSLIDGKRGKFVALVILVSIEEGILQKPTYKQVSDEFGYIGNKSGYNKYLNSNMYNKEEVKGIKRALQNKD